MAKIRQVLSSLSFVPSVSGSGVGAFPFGLPLMVWMAREPPPKFLLLLSFMMAVYLAINLGAISGVSEVLSFVIGPVAALLVISARPSEQSLGSLLVLAVLLTEAILGAYFSQGARSITFLTNEPSHAARWFFSIVAAHLVFRGWNAQLLVMGLAFVYFNASMTALMLFLGSLFIRRPSGKAKVLMVIAIGYGLMYVTSNIEADHKKRSFQYISQTIVAPIWSEGRLGSASDDVMTWLQSVGSRRLVQTIAGYVLSPPVRIGSVGDVHETFYEEAKGTKVDFTDMENIGTRPVVPNAYAANLSFMIGWVPALVFCFSAYVAFRLDKLMVINKPLFLFGVFQLLIFSTASLVTPWIFIGLACSGKPCRQILPSG